MQKNNIKIQELKGKTVVVGMSGGIDSSVACLLLKQAGANVIGLHMKTENENTNEVDKQKVIDVCEKLGVKLEVVEYKDEMKTVKDYFIQEYLAGRTPNPCVVCNREVKFKPFIEFAEKFNADYFATGHYAVVEHKGDKHYLKVAVDKNKDQSYFLCKLSQSQFQKALFPLGDLTKSEVRKLAQENGLAFEGVKESQDICFLGTQKFKEFMESNYPEKTGDIIDINSNKVVGKHTGISKYTIGQRKGLGIGGGHGETGESWSVVKKDMAKNIIYVCQGNSYYADGLYASGFNWIPEKPADKFECYAKFRYRQEAKKVSVSVLDDNKVFVEFKEKQTSIAEGQFVVLYNEDTCLGGGVIDEIYKK